MSQIMIENKLMNAFKVISHSKDLSKSCEEFVLPSLCYSSFPLCKRVDIPTPENICREDCELLENEICREEYAIAKKHNLIGQVISLSDCATLPSTECRNLNLPVPEPPNKDEECYQNDGSTYRGIVFETENGRFCMPWNHQLNLKTADYPELLGGHRFCRNPTGLFSQPWCYTSNNNVPTAERCKIPECDNMKPEAMIASIVILVVVIIFICFYCYTRIRRRKAKEALIAALKQTPNVTIIDRNTFERADRDEGSRLEMSSIMSTSVFNRRCTLEHTPAKVAHYPLEYIKFQTTLGEGAFGKVYKGEIREPGREPSLAAIKTLKDNATSKAIAEFKREVEVMSELNHANIICLIGVSLSSRMCMLFEYMCHGDLHKYLVSHAPNSSIYRRQGFPLDLNDLLNIALQVASGMDYLSNRHFVHRDLATRNCLVGENLRVKIADFGLTRDIYSSDYYRVEKSALLPIRWMPPESISYGKFTTESDIWSYGVVLWEIYSYGVQPYYAFNNKEVIEMVRSHKLLPQPDNCPDMIHQIMLQCWNPIPARRPVFFELINRLLQTRSMDNECENSMSSGCDIERKRRWFKRSSISNLKNIEFKK